MKVDSNDPRPPYAQIAAVMRAAIRTGELAPGERLPSGRELATQYGVALMTIQKALATLRDEGLVHSYRGRGTFVHGGKALPDSSTNLDDLKATVDELARRVKALEGKVDN